MAKLLRTGTALLPLKAIRRMEKLQYGPADRVSVALGAFSIDVTIDHSFDAAAQRMNIVPVPVLNWNTSMSVVPLPGKTDFTDGFRVIFGAAAPAGALMSYHMIGVQGQ